MMQNIILVTSNIVNLESIATSAGTRSAHVNQIHAEICPRMIQI